MGIYFEEERKKARWESGQAILHKETAQKEPQKKPEENEKKKETNHIKNSYGKLSYLKKDKKRGQEKEGFSLEAFEAPGTPLHTEKEKYIDRASMKNVIHGKKQMLFSSELPLRNQALFYDLAGSKKSKGFLECMKQLIHTRGHRTLDDAFGFLNQEPERTELKYLKDEQKEQMEQQGAKEILPEESTRTNHRIDTLSNRLLRKEAKERQLRQELQLMLDQRAKEEKHTDDLKHTIEDKEKQQKKNKKRTNYDTLQRQIQSGSETAETDTGEETEQPTDDTKNQSPDLAHQRL